MTIKNYTLFFLLFFCPFISSFAGVIEKDDSRHAPSPVVTEQKNIANNGKIDSNIKKAPVAKKNKIPVKIAEMVKPAQVTLDFAVLFSLTAPFNGVTAKERAQTISQRLEDISHNYNEHRDLFCLQKGDGFIDVMYNDKLAFKITDLDAQAANVELELLANKYLNSVKRNLLSHKYNLSSKEWVSRIWKTLLALLGLIVFTTIILTIFKKIDMHLAKIDRQVLKKKNHIIKYFIPRKNKNIFIFISRIIRFIILIIFLLTYLPLLFSFLPWTHGLVELIYDDISQFIHFLCFSFINFLPDLFIIIGIAYVARYIVRVMRNIAEDIEAKNLIIKGFPHDWANPTEKLLAIVVYAFALVVIFPHLPGSNSPAFKGVSIFLGVLFSLGSTSAIANIIAGIVITYMRPFKIGDRIQILDIVGDVIDRTLLITRINTIKNEVVTIPNATIINNHLINFTTNARKGGIILHTTISLGYDVPSELAESLLLQAADLSINLLKTPSPFVLQASLDDNYVSYELNVYSRESAKMAQTYSNLHKNILAVFNEAEVEILSPRYVAVRDGNESTIPQSAPQQSSHHLGKIIDQFTGRNQKIISKKD
jgi:small-conductance mechanosensitive channel